MFDIL